MPVGGGTLPFPRKRFVDNREKERFRGKVERNYSKISGGQGGAGRSTKSIRKGLGDLSVGGVSGGGQRGVSG